MLQIYRRKDLLSKSCYQKLNINDSFNEHLYRGENSRNCLKDTMKFNSSKQNLNLFEESLSKDLDKMKLSDEKARQLLWERSHELRQFKRKFFQAGVTKCQNLQMAEKKALQELKGHEDRCYADEIQRQVKEFEAEERRKEIAKFQSQLKYHKDLDNFRLFKVSEKSSSSREKEIERNAVDEILQKIKEEDNIAEERIRKNKRTFYKQALEQEKFREERRLQQKRQDELDYRRADEYRKAQELRAQEEYERKQLYYEQQLLVQEKLCSYLETLNSDQLKKELLRIELAVEEKEALEKEREFEKRIEKLIKNKEYQELYKLQMQLKKERKDLLIKENERYRQLLNLKWIEDNKLELASQQLSREKKMEHLQRNKAMIEEKRNKEKMERKREMDEHKYIKGLEAERARMVTEEKLKFLKEQPGDLIGYLPKGIFEEKELFDQCSDKFKNFYLRESCTK